MLKRTQTFSFSLGVLLVILSGCDFVKSADPSLLVSSGTDMFKAMTLSDAEVQNIAKQAAEQSDAQNQIASSDSQYTKRLRSLTDNLRNEDGMNLNFKVYLTEDVNAFAMADGTVRVYKGLMDMMNDDELRFVVGHEIGHVKLGHSKKAFQTAYVASAARKGVASQSNVAGQLAASQLGDLVEKVVNAQFSQSEEQQADDYGLKFMQAHHYDTNGAVSALKKLANLGGSHSFLSSHPDPDKRAKEIQDQL
jgi:putative metalloprotease